jgi:hypothetical protein
VGTVHYLAPAPSPGLDARFARAWEAAEEAEILAAIKAARAMRLDWEKRRTRPSHLQVVR